MKKIDFYLLALSLVFIILSTINYLQNGDFIFYILIATLIFIRSIKELISKSVFIVLGVLVSIITVLYIIFQYSV